MSTVHLTIDGQAVECTAGITILAAADEAGIYLPRLCSHPDLPPVNQIDWADEIWQGERKVSGESAAVEETEKTHCNFCLVQSTDHERPIRACATMVTAGMVVQTTSPEIVGKRRQSLSRILADHPHACLTCAQKEGCSRSDCSSNVPVAERCCILLGRCELEKVADYIGIPGDTPKYVPQNRPVIKNDPLFDRDFNLCIGCLRCVRACTDLRGLDILGAVWHEGGRVQVGTRRAAGLQDAACRFCGACVEVCPTGVLLDKEKVPQVRRDAALPCVGSCPAGIDIPGYLRLIAQGQDAAAVELIRSRAPFAGVLGYVCFHPCEESCRRSELDQPVAICALKRFAVDHTREVKPWLPAERPSTSKKIAILGAGPAGLTAAYFLALLGHQVTVFDRADKPGGMLRNAIPDYRLPREVLDRELLMITELGVEFKMNTEIGSPMGITQLRQQGFAAILLATGASRSKTLPIEGADLPGVQLGLDFLRAAKQPTPPRLDQHRVVVIGGGNVALDTAMTALRLGAAGVQVVCLESSEEMPAYKWEIKQATEEGIEILPGWGPKIFTGVDGQLTGVELRKCSRVFDEQGKFAPRYNEEQTRELPADVVILTIGQEIDPTGFENVAAASRGPGGTIKVDGNFSSTVDSVFAAGDLTRGPSSVVQAVADGRQAAEAIDKYLGGEGLVEQRPALSEIINPKLSASIDEFNQPRHVPPTADPTQRKSNFELLEQTLPVTAARAEAQRCLLCHLRQQITPPTLPPEPWLPFDREHADKVPETEGVFQLLNQQKKVIRISGTANLQQDVSDCLENPGQARYFIFEEYPLYSKRESELIGQHLQKYGEMPAGGGAGGDDDLDDLF